MTQKKSLATEGITMPRMAAFYDLMVNVLTLGREKRFRREILELAAIAPGERVLDVGCGTGTLALMAAALVGPDGEVVGVDATPQMVSRARRKASRRAIDVRFEEGLVEAIPSEDDRFDLVLTTFTMHHFPGELKARALSEMFRVLVPGGRLLIVDFPGHGHGVKAHRGGAARDEEACEELTGLVETAGFAKTSSGAMNMLGAIFVAGRKPPP